MADETNSEQLQQTMGLIANAGNAKAFAVEAIHAARDNDFAQADQKLDEANKALVDAHNSQTKMLTQEAQGHHVKLTLLTVHSQDRLMTAITFIDLAKELISAYKKMYELQK